jgi:predicted PurR-regulated permease PerM
VVLAAQLLFGALFGVLGLLLADPIVATIKVTLQKLSETEAMRAAGSGGVPKAAPAAKSRRKRR